MIMIKRVLGAVVAGASLVAAVALPASAESRFVPGVVNADGGLNARIAPSRYTAAQALLPDGAEVSIDCQVTGSIVGDEDDNLWYLLVGEGDARWVSAAYVELTGDKPGWCGSDPLPAKVIKDETTFLGPSDFDEDYRALQAGDDERVVCHVYTAAGGNDRWVLTTEGDWLPADAVKSDQEIPFCQA